VRSSPRTRAQSDYVDARRAISEYYLFGLLFFFAVLPIVPESALVSYLLWVLLLVTVAESLIVGNRVVRLVQQRFPARSDD